ncbi:MAG: NUDIX domain-containing protein [Oscillospiraceae bacterium]
MSESVLVVKTEYLAPSIAGRNGLISGVGEDILKIVNEKHEFLPRPEAEEDPGYKQIIPYVAVTRGDEVFVLRRLKKGGEARLHGLLSVGVGGHINPADDTRDEALMRGLRREVDEEISVEKILRLTPKGVINDDSNAVGGVHLGFFFTMEISGEVTVRETEKLSGEWVKTSELCKLKDQLENWSQIVMEEI